MFASPLFRLNIPPRIVSGGGGGAADSVNDSSLQAYWRLDESSGTRADTKGTNNLTENGGTVSSATAIISSGAQFNGSDNLSVASNSGLQLNSTSDFSFTCWFKTTTISPVQTLSAKGNEWLVWLNGSTLQFVHAAGGGVNGLASASTSIVANTWYWVCITLDHTGTKTITVNATNQSFVFNVNPTAATNPMVVGNDSTSGGHPFTGIIDEALFSKRVLTSTEITALYNSGTGLRPSGV